jgi:hypothetical protein
MSKTKINEFKKISQLVNEVKDEFFENLKQLFVDNPKLALITIRVNNHEFNDGDTTSFSLYYEDLTVMDADGNEYERLSYIPKDSKKENHPLTIAVYELFEEYDIMDLHERIYGNEHSRIVITRSETLNK